MGGTLKFALSGQSKDDVKTPRAAWGWYEFGGWPIENPWLAE
ncbi:MAG: hypothetical protein ACJAQT_002607 [Akkermansiaceae bacterium]|jgi:hypothetical protein